MISLLMAAALAATPEELAEAMPAAEDQLLRCATDGCTRDEGARAAFVVAVGTYVAEGEADGALAATVRVLDPALFSDLPDVLQASAAEPLHWATWVGGRQVVENPARPLPELEEKLPAEPYIRDPTKPLGELWVHVTDVEGNVVPTARIRFVDEQDTHRVHSETGMWTASMLYLPDGTERYFQRGDDFAMHVWAPGYGITRSRFYYGKRRKMTIRVTLFPWTPTLVEGAPPVAIDAVDAFERWVEQEAAFLAAPSAAADEELHGVRRNAARAAREWLDAGGGDTAKNMCLMTGSLSLCGR